MDDSTISITVVGCVLFSCLILAIIWKCVHKKKLKKAIIRKQKAEQEMFINNIEEGHIGPESVDFSSLGKPVCSSSHYRRR